MPTDDIDPTAYIRIDKDALMRLAPIDRFHACHTIKGAAIKAQVDEIRDGAVLELADRYGRTHGTNTKVAELLGVTGAFVGQRLKEADSRTETHEQARVRLDREEVEDITAAPGARLRAVQSLEQAVERFLPGAAADVERGDFDSAHIMIGVIHSAAADALRVLAGDADPARLYEARAIEEGRAAHQEHTYRLRLSYRETTGVWVEYADREWDDLNMISIAEASETAAWVVTGLYERRGESTPGRAWRLEMWNDRNGTGEPDYTREHVETAPTDADRFSWEVTQDAIRPDGTVDIARVRRVIHERLQEGEKR